MKPTLMYFLVTKKTKTKTAQSCHTLVKDTREYSHLSSFPVAKSPHQRRGVTTQTLEREQERLRILSFLAHISSHYCFFFQAPDTQAKERQEVAAFEGLVEGKVLVTNHGWL